MAEYNLKAKQGDTFRTDPIQWQAGGVGKDLTGLSGRGQVRTNAQSSAIVAEFTVVIDDIEEGFWHAELTSEQTAEIPAYGLKPTDVTQYVYDIEFYDAGTYVKTILEGIFEISPEVTRVV